MKSLVGLVMATLMMCSSVLAGGIFITISGNGGQIKTEAQEFRYAQSPRELAGGSSMATAVAATNARSSGGRAAMRRLNEPIAIVHKLDESSPFFKKPLRAAKRSLQLSLSSNAQLAPVQKSIKPCG